MSDQEQATDEIRAVLDAADVAVWAAMDVHATPGGVRVAGMGEAWGEFLTALGVVADRIGADYPAAMTSRSAVTDKLREATEKYRQERGI